ncbi:MAG: EAL domain-containing protein [Lachnospiraceae bacterium]|nr:EAL domain-containing protein [Lachnospiraceae bacterium]
MARYSEIIPLFEGNGLIQKLDNYVWEEAAHQIRKWREKYDRAIPVSVNVSRIDIYDPTLENKLLRLTETYDITAG